MKRQSCSQCVVSRSDRGGNGSCNTERPLWGQRGNAMHLRNRAARGLGLRKVGADFQENTATELGQKGGVAREGGGLLTGLLEERSRFPGEEEAAR